MMVIIMGNKTKQKKMENFLCFVSQIFDSVIKEFYCIFFPLEYQQKQQTMKKKRS